MIETINIVYLRRTGGIGYFTAELAKSLSKLVQVRCFLSEYGQLNDRFKRLPVSVQCFPTYRNVSEFLRHSFTLSRVRDISDALTRSNADFVLDTGSGMWGNLVKARTPKLRWASVIHDVSPHDERVALATRLMDFVAPEPSETLVALSSSAAAELRCKYPNRSIVQSAHGVIHQSKGEFSTPEDIADRRNRFLFFGRIERYKGLDDLVNAFVLAREKSPSISLSVLGAGPIESSTLRKIQSSGIRLINRWITDNEIDGALREHGVVVLPYREATQSGVAAAALGSGLPIIATLVGALPEQVIDGVNGLVVPPNSPELLAGAICKLASSAQLAREFAKNSLSLSNEVGNWDLIAKTLIQNLQDLISQRTHQGS